MDLAQTPGKPKFQLFRTLANPIFCRLYAAQTISLLGDAFTWVGLALLTFDLGHAEAIIALSGALTLRVSAFVFFSPLAGAIADRFDRKLILILTHLARMVIVGLFPFATAIWHIYVLMVALNLFNAFFTPTYRATIPLILAKEDYAGAIALSNATGQLLSIIGPGLAGAVATVVGARPIFWVDAAGFLLAALLMISLPGELKVGSPMGSPLSWRSTWHDIQLGTLNLFQERSLRYALGMQLVAAIAGAQILVNTVGYVKGVLNLSSLHYGWVMAAFGTGATLAAALSGRLVHNDQRLFYIGLGALLITLALLPANAVGLLPLLLLWALAGLGESWINIPTQTLIAEKIPTDIQGRVYGAHFAWSHLWWLFGYPLAGWLGTTTSTLLPTVFQQKPFLDGGLLALLVLLGVQLWLAPRPQQETAELS